MKIGKAFSVRVFFIGTWVADSDRQPWIDDAGLRMFRERRREQRGYRGGIRERPFIGWSSRSARHAKLKLCEAFAGEGGRFFAVIVLELRFTNGGD